MMRHTNSALAMILAAALVAAGVSWVWADPVNDRAGATAGGSPYVMHRSSIDAGAITNASGGAYSLSATIGQPDAGYSSGDAYQFYGGFRFPVLPGDGGEDGDVDLTDVAAFELCTTGPGVYGPVETCRVFDVDRSGAVDLADFAEVQVFYTGP